MTYEPVLDLSLFDDATLGEWHVGELRHGFDCLVRSSRNDPIAGVFICGSSSHESQANAELIAAAPSLLDELRKARTALDEFKRSHGSRHDQGALG